MGDSWVPGVPAACSRSSGEPDGVSALESFHFRVQDFPLLHELSEFPLEAVVFFHCGAEKLVIAIQLLRGQQFCQNGYSGFMQLDLSLKPFDLFFLLLDLVGIDPLFSQARLAFRLIFS